MFALPHRQIANELYAVLYIDERINKTELMNRQKTLLKLGIVIPRKNACYKNNIAITETYLNWLNPFTYPYFLGSILFMLYVYLMRGESGLKELIK